MRLFVSDKAVSFAPQGTSEQVEEGHVFAPKFDSNGLIGCIVTDAWTAEVLMFAHMNAEALAKTIASGEAWYFSRSRGRLWKKGEISGHGQRVVEMRVDCDQDALMLRVEQAGAGACHTGREILLLSLGAVARDAGSHADADIHRREEIRSRQGVWRADRHGNSRQARTARADQAP